SELASAVYFVAGETLPLEVTASEWVGVSHDTRDNRDIIHLFNYHTDQDVAGVRLKYNGSAKNAWSISPDEPGKSSVFFSEKNGTVTLEIPNLHVYKIIVLEKYSGAVFPCYNAIESPECLEGMVEKDYPEVFCSMHLVPRGVS